MQILKNKAFGKFARKESISDAKLCEAVKDANEGKIDADYGGGVIKQRIARINEGISGGSRSIILFRSGEKAFFVYGFAKKDRDNIDKAEEKAFKKLATQTFKYTNQETKKLIENGTYKEVICDDKI